MKQVENVKTEELEKLEGPIGGGGSNPDPNQEDGD